MSLYHLGSLMTFAYLAFLAVALFFSKYIFEPLIQDIFRDLEEGWKRVVVVFIGNLLWTIYIVAIGMSVHKYIFNFPI